MLLPGKQVKRQKPARGSGYLTEGFALGQNRRLEDNLDPAEQLRTLTRRFQNDCAAAGMAVHAHLMTGGQVLQGLVEHFGVVGNGAGARAQRGDPLGFAVAWTVDRDMVVGAGQHDQLQGRILIVRREIQEVLDKTGHDDDALRCILRPLAGNAGLADLIQLTLEIDRLHLRCFAP